MNVPGPSQDVSLSEPDPPRAPIVCPCCGLRPSTGWQPSFFRLRVRFFCTQSRTFRGPAGDEASALGPVRYPYWCIRVGKPFGRLILQGLKPWETRVDYKEKPRVLASLPAGTIVLVYLDDLAFPPNASAEVREATEADIAELLSRKNKEVAADSAPGQFGTICPGPI